MHDNGLCSVMIICFALQFLLANEKSKLLNNFNIFLFIEWLQCLQYNGRAYFFEKRHGRSSILALNIFPVDVSKSAMNKFIPYLQFGKINCLLCHVSKYGEYEMLHQSEDPKRKEINMIFENSVIRISNFFRIHPILSKKDLLEK